jgi:hypothetical protein
MLPYHRGGFLIGHIDGRAVAFGVGGGQKVSHYRGQFDPPLSLPIEFIARPVIGLTRP